MKRNSVFQTKTAPAASREYKSTMFCMIFRDKKQLLELYNAGNNRELLAGCRTLWEYMQYVECVRKYADRPGTVLEEAVECAVRECIDRGILQEFLRKNKAEAVSVSIFEYNEAEEKEKLRRAEYGVGYDAGVTDGTRKGMEQGLRQGIEMGAEQEAQRGIQILIATCKELGASFEETAARLKEKYALDNEEVQRNMQMYW